MRVFIYKNFNAIPLAFLVISTRVFIINHHMKSKTTYILAFIICAFLLSSSSTLKENTDQKEDTNTLVEHLGKPIDINLKGTVVNHNNEPLDSVTITVGNQTVQTDAQGQFEIKNATAYDNFLPVEAQRKGYKDTFFSLNSEVENSEIDIRLTKKENTCLFWFCKHNHNLPVSAN